MKPHVGHPATPRRASQILLLVGASHRTGTVADRESLLRRPTYARLRRAGGRQPPWDDLVILTTCNRVEIYTVTTRPGRTLEALAEALGTPTGSPKVYVLEGREAAAHLLRVASGLDSLAQGEEQIASQVREAPRSSPASLRTRGVLDPVFLHAARVARRIRRLAALEGEPMSASHAAIRFIESAVPLDHPIVVLVGTGKMARLAAEGLRGRATLLVVSRSRRTAREFEKAVASLGRGPRALEKFLVEADVVLAATAVRKPLITLRLLSRIMKERAGRPLWMVDLGFPRNIEDAVRTLPNVALLDLDGLAPWGFHPLPPSVQARVEARIRREAERIVRTIDPKGDRGVAEFRKAAEALRQQEVAKAFSRLPRLTDEERAIVDKLAARLLNRLLHGPTQALRLLPDEVRPRVLDGFRAGLGLREGRSA